MLRVCSFELFRLTKSLELKTPEGTTVLPGRMNYMLCYTPKSTTECGLSPPEAIPHSADRRIAYNNGHVGILFSEERLWSRTRCATANLTRRLRAGLTICWAG